MRLTVTVLLLPVLAAAVRIFMATQRETAMSDAEIFGFFVSAPGITVLITAGILWSAAAFVEQAALMTIGYAAVDGRRLDWVGALRYVATKLGILLPLGAYLLARILILVIPFLLAAVLIIHLALGRYHHLFEEHDVYYFLYHRPPGLGWALALVLLLLSAMLFLLSFRAVGWLLAIPAVLFENLGPTAAIKDSVADSKGHRWQLAGLLTLWISVGAITAIVGTWMLGTAGRAAIPLAGDSPAFITFTIGATGFIALVFYALVSLFATALFAFSAVRVYRHCSGPGELPAIDGETDFSQPASVSLPGENILLSAAGAMVLAVLSATVLLSGLENPAERASIVAHRGDSANAPENTLAAVKSAIEKGADSVEVDAQLTKDSVVIICHDAMINQVVKDGGRKVANFEEDGLRLKKTDDGRVFRAEGNKVIAVRKRTGKVIPAPGGGEWIYINDLTYEELSGIDVGSWWVDESGFGEQFRGATIPTLDQVLTTCHEAGLEVMIELKYDGEFDQPELARLVSEAVRKRETQDEVVVVSIDSTRLREMKNRDPGLKVGQLFFFQPRRSELLSDIELLGVHKLGVSRRFLAAAENDGLEVYVFTVDDPFAMSAMVSRGVDGIITNHPRLAREVLDFRRKLNPLQRLLIAIGAEVGMFGIFG